MEDQDKQASDQDQAMETKEELQPVAQDVGRGRGQHQSVLGMNPKSSKVGKEKRQKQRRRFHPGAGAGAGAAMTMAAVATKNAVTTLNELRPGLKYELVETKGPVHRPTFVLQVCVNGQAFRGEGW